MSIGALAGHIDSYFIGSGITTSATIASMSADAGADTDSRNENIRNLNNLAIDVAVLNKTVGDLLETLRDRRLIPNP